MIGPVRVGSVLFFYNMHILLAPALLLSMLWYLLALALELVKQLVLN